LNRYLSLLFSITILALLSGCAASTLSNAEDRGATRLTVQEIFDLTSRNTLRLISSDFDSHIYFSEDGSITAKSVFNNNVDNGSWDIKSDGSLCIKFEVWYYGDVNCYTTYKDPENDQYLLFTTNGALAYTAKSMQGNSQGMKIVTKKGKRPVFVRSSMTKGQPAPVSAAKQSAPQPPVAAPVTTSPANPAASQEAVQQTVKNIAQDCPGCNFEDADLRQAYLVGANLKGANLSGADLSRANLRRANLEGADLTGATMLSTNLPGANLKDADLSGADLTGSNLIQANFTGATVKGVIFDNTLKEGSKGL
jgi:hypothetical protein